MPRTRGDMMGLGDYNQEESVPVDIACASTTLICFNYFLIHESETNRVGWRMLVVFLPTPRALGAE